MCCSVWQLWLYWALRYTVCRRTLYTLRHLVAHLSVVTDFASRNLPGSFFQLCHQHFIEHQKCPPEDKKKIMQAQTTTATTRELPFCSKIIKRWWGDENLPAESGPWWRALIFWCIEELRDSLSSYFLHCIQNIFDMFQVDAAEKKDKDIIIQHFRCLFTILTIPHGIINAINWQLCTLEIC